MSYLDQGYNLFLSKVSLEPQSEYMDEQTSSLFGQISGTLIKGGVTTTGGGKLKIDWDNAVITLSNANDQEIEFSGSKNRITFYDSGVPTSFWGEP